MYMYRVMIDMAALAFDGRLCKKRRHSDIPTHRIWDVLRVERFEWPQSDEVTWAIQLRKEIFKGSFRIWKVYWSGEL